MSDYKQNMDIMQFMCQREVEQLQKNLSYYLIDSVRVKNFISSYNDGSKSGNNLNEFSLVAYDSYMSNLEMVIDMTRKFNIHLQLKPLSKNISYFEDHRHSFKDIIQCNISDEKHLAKFESVSNITSEETILPSRDDNSLFNSNTECVEPVIVKSTTNEISLKSQTDKRKVSFQLFKPQLLQMEMSKFIENYEFNAPISYVEDYDKLIFYIRPHENSLLTELSNMFYLPKLSDAPTTENEIIGLSFSNDMIVRAVIPPSSNKIKPYKALLIDYGDIVSISDECVIYKLPIKYQNLPMQAVKCFLIGVISEQCNDPTYMTNILKKKEYSTCQFRVVRNEDQILHVLMLLEDEKNENNAVQEALSMSGQNKDGKTLNPFMFSSEDEDDFNYKASNDLQDAIPKSALPSGDISSKTVCSSNTMLKTRNGNVDDELDDKQIFVTPTFIVDIETFYAQIEDDPYNPLEPLIWTDDKVSQSQRLLEKPKLNDIVLAKYIIDGHWYRAKVVDICDNNQLFKVFYLDYGNSETVSLDCIAKCFCLSEPYRAVRCRLGDICSIAQSDKIEHQRAIDSLCLAILNQTFEVKILRRTENELWVRIVDENFVDVSKYLISKGYVKEIEGTLNMEENTKCF